MFRPKYKFPYENLQNRFDLPLIGATLFLLSWGTVMIYSTGGVYADLQYNDGQYFLYRHLMHMLVGLILMTVALVVNYHKWQQYSIWLKPFPS